MFLVPHKMVFVENKTAFMRSLPLQSFCVVQYSNAFWLGNKAFLKVNSSNKIVPLLVIFNLPYSQYRSVKICFHSCRYQNQNFSLVSQSCRSCLTHIARVALMSHLCRSSYTRVAK